MVYLAAAAEAKVGGDLYEVTRTAEHGIRVIMGDVRGKGLGAVELAADVLGMFRELAHDAFTLAELAARLDAGSAGRLGRHEEFVTALLVEIDPESGRTSIFNCGHPPPLLIPATASGAAAGGDPPWRCRAPAPPLGLLALGDCSDAQLSCTLCSQMTSCSSTPTASQRRATPSRAFYPLPDRVSVLTAGGGSRRPARTPSAGPRGRHPRRAACSTWSAPTCIKHVGAPLDDDAALLLVRAPAILAGRPPHRTPRPGNRLAATLSRMLTETAQPPTLSLWQRDRPTYRLSAGRAVCRGYADATSAAVPANSRAAAPPGAPPAPGRPAGLSWPRSPWPRRPAAAVCLTQAWPSPLELAPLLAVAARAGRHRRGSRQAPARLRRRRPGRRPSSSTPCSRAASPSPTARTSCRWPPRARSRSPPRSAWPGSVVGARARRPRAGQQDQQFANVTSVAEAAQRAVLRPLPEQLGPLKLGVVYLAAAAEARVGGDLYEVTPHRDHGIRLIIGDVRGKGLGAVEVAADIIGRFREVAHSVGTLNEVAYRLDAGLSRRWGQYEEFVTALLAEIDPDRGKLTILNCGHPPPILISPEDGVTVLEVRAPAPPLGLLTLGSDAGAKEVFTFKPNDQLLLYTDGVTEARDASREFYPLDERVKALAPQAQPKADARRARSGAPTARVPTLLDLVRDDLLRYVGAPPRRRRGAAARPRPRRLAGRPPGGQRQAVTGVHGSPRTDHPNVTARKRGRAQPLVP